MNVSKKNGSKLIWIITLLSVVVLVGAAYFVFQSKSKDGEPAASNETSKVELKKEPEVQKQDVAAGTVITTGDSEYGPMLFDARGQAIYIWEIEDSSTPKCYGPCAEAWPPVLTTGDPVASGDVNEKMLGTSKRSDGTTQVTYNGHPLYFYANEKPGEVECHNIKTHGGLWWVIQPNGVRAQ